MSFEQIKLRKRFIRAENSYRRFLYKYKSAEPISHIRDLIVESRLWFSTPSDFNDPFDMKINVYIDGNREDVLRRIKKSIIRTGLINKNLDPDVEAVRAYSRLKGNDAILRTAVDAHERTKETCGVICFSEDPRNILMWSHYGSFHKGICFQFLVTNDTARFARALPVHYRKDYPKHNWVKDSENQLLEAVYTKFDDWSYEKEWRITFPDHAHQYLEINPIALTGIIYGCNAPEETILNIQTLISERSQKSLPAIKQYRAIQSDSSYTVRIARLA